MFQAEQMKSKFEKKPRWQRPERTESGSRLTKRAKYDGNRAIPLTMFTKVLLILTLMNISQFSKFIRIARSLLVH